MFYNGLLYIDLEDSGNLQTLHVIGTKVLKNLFDSFTVSIS